MGTTAGDLNSKDGAVVQLDQSRGFLILTRDNGRARIRKDTPHPQLTDIYDKKRKQRVRSKAAKEIDTKNNGPVTTAVLRAPAEICRTTIEGASVIIFSVGAEEVVLT